MYFNCYLLGLDCKRWCGLCPPPHEVMEADDCLDTNEYVHIYRILKVSQM